MAEKISPSVSLTSHLDAIADELRTSGWLVIPDFLAEEVYRPLLARATALQPRFIRAGIGRGLEHQANAAVRSDSIFWLDGADPADQIWLACMEQLRVALNQRLFLGLFEYEAHYACFEAGSFYRRHRDAFRGEGNRVLTTVFYLNPGWRAEDGGELVIYSDAESSGESARVAPRGGTLALFLSEEFPHEVLCSQRTRYSIAGWFRLNANRGDRLDPPR